MKTNCTDVQNEILQGNYEKIKPHLASCKDCMGFYNQYKNILNLIPAKTGFTSDIEFNDLYVFSSKPEKIINIFSFKYASLLAAAMLIIAIYIPKSLYNTPTSSFIKNPEVKTYSVLSEGIKKEMISIDSIINEMEKDFYPDDSFAYKKVIASNTTPRPYIILAEGINKVTKNIDKEITDLERDIYTDEGTIHTEIELLYNDINNIKEG